MITMTGDYRFYVACVWFTDNAYFHLYAFVNNATKLTILGYEKLPFVVTTISLNVTVWAAVCHLRETFATEWYVVVLNNLSPHYTCWKIDHPFCHSYLKEPAQTVPLRFSPFFKNAPGIESLLWTFPHLPEQTSNGHHTHLILFPGATFYGVHWRTLFSVTIILQKWASLKSWSLKPASLVPLAHYRGWLKISLFVCAITVLWKV